MIDRYSLTASSDVVKDRFGVDVLESYKPRFNAAPTHLLPVMTSQSPQGLSNFYWGTSPEWSKNKTLAEKMINVRIETLMEKPALKRALKKNRCLIPADGFYCWKKVGKKTSIPYRFTLATKEPFAFAGIWEEFEDTEGHEIQTFMIFTTPADAVVGLVHDRMPIIVSRQNEGTWLDATADEDQLVAILNDRVSIALMHYPVSPAITDMHADFASMIIPTAPADQHGNLTLFD